MFIDGSNISSCKLERSVLDSICLESEMFFCWLLPLKKQDRLISRDREEVLYIDWRNKISTNLLHVNSVKQWDNTLTIKVCGLFWSDVLFKEDPVFDPYCDLIVNSWYDTSTIPDDIKYAMIKYAQDKANTMSLWMWDNVISYKLWPREVKFSSPDTMSFIQDILSNYSYF
jgi:hypothetical protein